MYHLTFSDCISSVIRHLVFSLVIFKENVEVLS